MANKEAEPVKISFRKLGLLLEEKGKKWQFLRDNGISPGIVAKMKDGSGHTDTRTIQKVCEIMNCQPKDIMEYIPNDKNISMEMDGEQVEGTNETKIEQSSQADLNKTPEELENLKRLQELQEMIDRRKKES